MVSHSFMKWRNLSAAAALPLLAASLAAQNVSYSNPYTISTLAGTPGSAGYIDSTQGSNAAFSDPAGVAYDSSGDIYVADTNNYVIREVTPSGAVSTVAGTGTMGEQNGAALAAQFGPVYGIARDSQGNLYVSDWVTSAGTSAVLRKISGGMVTTLATGLDQPEGLTVDSSGNVYVADVGDFTIRKVTPSGTVSVYAGTLGEAGYAMGAPGTGQFGAPTSVAIDASGNLYVADCGNSVIVKVNSSGTMSVYSGTPNNPVSQDGTLTSATYSHPAGIAIDGSGNLYLIDDESLVREISAGGTVTTLAGVPGVFGELDGAGPNAEFNFAAAIGGIAATAGGDLAIADTSSDTIRTGVLLAAAPPTIQHQPTGESVNNGGTAILSVAASGANLTYQWEFNDGVSTLPIAGATSPNLTLQNIGANQGGTYSVVVTDASGSTTSNAATITVLTDAWFKNVSTLANVGTGANVLDAGFVLGGTGSKPMLVRGAGPTLATSFGLSNVLANPVLTLYDANNNTIAANTGWNNSATLSAAFTATGAFAYETNSADSALLQTLASGRYSATVSGVNNTTGTAIVEVYDDNLSDTSEQLINISSRALVTPSASLTAGFIIGGSTPMTVLVRGVGPALSGYDVSNALANTTLTVNNATNQAVVASNTSWGGSTSLSDMFTKVGAFSLPAGSADSAVVVTLPPGSYSATVTPADGKSSGVALVEVYEIP